MAEQPTLETERLLLRPFELADAGDVQCLAGDRRVAEMTTNIPHPYEDGMAEHWFETHPQSFENGEAVTFAIVCRESGELVGAVGLMDMLNYARRGEIGYWVGVPFWNRGYCTEAARAIVDYGFATLGLQRIFGRFMARNPASGRVMEKCGMRREGCLRRHETKWGEPVDMVLYGILREEWAGGR